jgi:hypothetical protein
MTEKIAQATTDRRGCRLYWAIVLALYLVLVAVNMASARQRYENLQSGWSWDLAYYNQWFWALGHGDGQITVRPIASYAVEGPSVWKANYLAPIRLIILPIHWLRPDPTTLLYFECAVFWLIVPAAAKLLIDETGDVAVSLAALILVPLIPLARPLAENDFREIQIASPFVLLAIAGWRRRHRGWAALGIAGMLACRQEWAVVVASLPLIPPKHPERPEVTMRWTRVVVYTGIVWFFFVFLGYLRLTAGKSSPRDFLNQFGGPRPTLLQTLSTTSDFLWIGLSSWIFLAFLAPRLSIVALPWVWTLASGKWAIRFIGAEQWHHVRYCTPFFVLFLAAALVGWSRLWSHSSTLLGKSRGRAIMGLVWVLMAIWSIDGQFRMTALMQGIPIPVPAEDVGPLWAAFAQVRPDDGVVAHYDLTAPLSSRRLLYSYIMQINEPKGWPHALPNDIRHLFLDKGRKPAEVWESQGFSKAWSGRAFEWWRR